MLGHVQTWIKEDSADGVVWFDDVVGDEPVAERQTEPYSDAGCPAAEYQLGEDVWVWGDTPGEVIRRTWRTAGDILYSVRLVTGGSVHGMQESLLGREAEA